jgi:hypothetical protein
VNDRNSSSFCFTVIESEQDADGYVPCVVFEGENGYVPAARAGENVFAPPSWGPCLEEARAWCQTANARLGISVEQAERLVAAALAGEATRTLAPPQLRLAGTAVVDSALRAAERTAEYAADGFMPRSYPASDGPEDFRWVVEKWDWEGRELFYPEP